MPLLGHLLVLPRPYLKKNWVGYGKLAIWLGVVKVHVIQKIACKIT